MRQARTDYSSIELATLFRMTHAHLLIGVAAGRYPLPDYIDEKEKEQYWRASTVATLIGAIGAPLGVDASLLIEGMHRIEEGSNGAKP